MKRDIFTSRGIAAWAIGSALVALLGLSSFIAYEGLTFGSIQMSAAGYIAMTVGVILSLMMGIGLMALLFYSSREGYDEPPRLIPDAQSDRTDQ
jgi:hypothetical protein